MSDKPIKPKIMAKNWHKNKNGEYEYGFNWINEEGNYAGWNQVWAKSMGEARRKAKKKESPARWFTYDIRVDGKVIKNGGRERMKGLYIDPKSFKRRTLKESMEMDRIANRLMA